MIKLFLFAFLIPNGLPITNPHPDEVKYNTSLRGISQLFSTIRPAGHNWQIITLKDELPTTTKRNKSALVRPMYAAKLQIETAEEAPYV